MIASGPSSSARVTLCAGLAAGRFPGTTQPVGRTSNEVRSGVARFTTSFAGSVASSVAAKRCTQLAAGSVTPIPAAVEEPRTTTVMGWRGHRGRRARGRGNQGRGRRRRRGCDGGSPSCSVRRRRSVPRAHRIRPGRARRTRRARRPWRAGPATSDARGGRTRGRTYRPRHDQHLMDLRRGGCSRSPCAGLSRRW